MSIFDLFLKLFVIKPFCTDVFFENFWAFLEILYSDATLFVELQNLKVKIEIRMMLK